jgi:hypothetical protein
MLVELNYLYQYLYKRKNVNVPTESPRGEANENVNFPTEQTSGEANFSDAT